MQLCDILTESYTDESFLAHQRQLHRARIEKETAFILEKREDAAYIERLRAECAHYLADMHALPGTAGVRIHIGTPPAWNECRTNDEEYIWHLNRMGYFAPLCEMYLLTGQTVYAEKVLQDTLHWIDSCPSRPIPAADAPEEEFWSKASFYRGNVGPWRSLEIGIRGGTWSNMYSRLLFSPCMTPAIHSKLVCSLYEQALILHNTCPRFWPNANHNHFLTEMIGLLHITCILPDTVCAEQWRQVALHHIGRCASNQFHPEGAQIEGCPGYHSGCLGEYMTIARMAADYGFAFPDAMRALCDRATRHTMFCVKPDGNWASVGDTAIRPGGLHTALSYYKTFGELGPAAAIFAVHPTYDTRTIPEAVQVRARAEAAALPGDDNDQRTLGQYMARTGWRREDSYFLFTCKTPVNNGHSQQDVMSFILSLKGEPITADPSYFTYRECPERKMFKSPEYHCCLTFDDKPPYEYVNRWSFSPQKEGHIRKSYKFPGVFAADASHHNYDPDFHKRLCMLVGDDTFIVADDVANVSGADVRLWFHMDDPATRIEEHEAVNAHVRVLLPEGCDAQVLPGEKSPFTDLREPTARICLTDTAHQSRPYLTVFTKRADLRAPAIWREGDAMYIRYTTDEGERTFCWRMGCSLTEVK